MQKHGYTRCTPRNTDTTMERRPPIDFSSGYFQRTMDKLPRQGSRKPWRIHQNYLADLVALRFAPLNDGVLEFSGRSGTPDRRANPQPDRASA
jgi:monooxygenase